MRHAFAVFLAALGAISSAQEASTRNPRNLPLPERAKGPGARFVDLNGDGHEDIVVSNAEAHGVYLFVPKDRERTNLQWFEGWTQVLREGATGDANSLPLIARKDGVENEVRFENGFMIVKDTSAPGGETRVSFAELLKVPGPAPKPPQESLTALHLKPGFRAELVATEPLVQDPVYLDWDHQGRMWVVEMGDYPFAPGETTKDARVGQPPLAPGATRPPLMAGRVKILEDVNDDGVYDKAALFLDGLLHPTSLAPWKNGVIIANIPDIFFAEDTDGDGKCDRRESWFTGFAAGNPQHLVNGFAWGLDGWFYGANGDSGGDITCVKTGRKIALGTNDFRFHPVTGEFALEAGRSQYGKWRDDYGNWFGNNNSVLGWHYWLPLAHLERNPGLAVKATRSVLNDDKRVFPASPPVRRFNWASAVNTLTSACAPVPYRDEAFGAAGRDVIFICEPANNLVHRQLLDYTQMPVTSRRHPDDTAGEFIASEDNWFRPTIARMGPDGALYVADMYRLVLEHPEWIPAEIAHGMDLRAGEDRGRIYRISREGMAAQKWRAPEDLLSAMKSSNGWVRDTAQRLLLEREEKTAARSLLVLGEDQRQPAPVRIQALFTASQLGALPPDDLAARLRALFPRVRGGALAATGMSGKDLLHERESTFLREQIAGGNTKPVAAVPVITNHNPDRQKVVARYNKEVAALKPDASRGQAVFQKACLACHKAHGQGVEVGPDLATVITKPDEQLIEAIFDPNRAVEQRNAATQITKKDGGTLLGQLVTETPSSVTLRLPGGAEMVVPHADTREMKTLNTSLMLVGLESVISPQDCADLLAWLRSPSP
jgi:putative membrane-bound dehydrogenase-like protein